MHPYHLGEAAQSNNLKLTRDPYVNLPLNGSLEPVQCLSKSERIERKKLTT